MDHDFGKRLEKARVERGLSIEQAADAVRIRGTFLRALENSDLTKFPNAAYSKSFLLMYSRFLGVDLKAIAGEIDTTTQMKVEGYQYLTNRAVESPKSKAETEPVYSMAPPPRASGSLLPLFVLVALGILVAAAVIFWTNVNRIGESPGDTQKSDATRPGDETGVQPLTRLPGPAPAPARGTDTVKPPPPAPAPAETAPPKPLGNSEPPADEPGIPRARPISPVGRIAASDAAVLADVPVIAESRPAAEDAGTIVLAPRRKTWVVIRSSPGGQPLYEDFLSPTARPMRLPAGRYFIELKDADAVEISRDGKHLAYTAPGLAIQ